MKRKLSEDIVKALPAATKTSSYIVWDYDVPGFGVRITERGTKSFILNYSFKGVERRMVLARYFPDQNTVALARADAAKNKALIFAKKDPIAVIAAEEEASEKGHTFAELAKRYQRDYVRKKTGLPKRQSSKASDKSLLDGILLPRFGSKKLTAIESSNIDDLMGELRETPYRANRCRSLLHAMFEFARSKNANLMPKTSLNPVTKDDVRKYEEHEREFFLNEKQLLDFLSACDRYSDQNAADALRLLLETGSRKSEVLQSRWEMFHLQPGPLHNKWVKPPEMTKQGKIEHLDLGVRALALLKKMGPKDKGYLFPSKGGFDKPRTSLQKPWTQICKLAGLTEAITKPGKRRHAVTKHKPILRLHDLRHSYASYLVSHGWSLEKIGKLLGHNRKSTATARYAKVSPESAREAANAFLADVPVPPAKKPVDVTKVVRVRAANGKAAFHKETRKRAKL
jgi:integrase